MTCYLQQYYVASVIWSQSVHNAFGCIYICQLKCGQVRFNVNAKCKKAQCLTVYKIKTFQMTWHAFFDTTYPRCFPIVPFLISKLDMQNFAIRLQFSNFLKSSLYAAAVQKDSSLNSNRTGQYWKPPDLPGQEMSIQCHLLAGRTAKGRSKITFLSTVLGHKRIGCRHKFVLCLFNCFWAQKQKANHSNKMQTYIGKCLLTKIT